MSFLKQSILKWDGLFQKEKKKKVERRNEYFYSPGCLRWPWGSNDAFVIPDKVFEP